MTWLLLASALAGEVLTLPHGRVAVITPDEAPTQLVVSAPGVLSVTAAQPHLLVLGKNPGRSTLGLVHDGGRRDWTVEVSSDPATPIAGSYVAEVPTAPIPLAVDGGVLLPFPDDGTAVTVVRPKVAQASLFGERWLWVQGDSRGVTDVLIERDDALPQLLTVTVGEAGPRPPDAAEEATEVRVPDNGEAVLSLARRPAGTLVAHRGRVRLSEDPDHPGDLTLRGTHAGRTYVVLGFTDGTVQVVPVRVGPPPSADKP